MLYEHRTQPLLPRRAFLLRLASHTLVAIGSYLWLAPRWGSWAITSRKACPGSTLVNASMLLGGMGPVDALHTTAGKLFASFYALYSGMVFLVAVGIIFAPVFHRILHRFHLESGADDSADSSGS